MVTRPLSKPNERLLQQTAKVKPYSNDLRERVVERFGVSVSSAVKWHQRYRRTGSVRPGAMGGNRGSALDAHCDFIPGQFQRTPHLTLHGFAAISAADAAAFTPRPKPYCPQTLALQKSFPLFFKIQ
jgi:transposase